MTKAKANKQTGIDNVLNTNKAWVEGYLSVARTLPPGRYTGEDVRLAVEPKVGNPKHPNAWGGAFFALLRRTGTMFRPLSKMENMTTPRSHARLTRVYTKRR